MFIDLPCMVSSIENAPSEYHFPPPKTLLASRRSWGKALSTASKRPSIRCFRIHWVLQGFFQVNSLEWFTRITGMEAGSTTRFPFFFSLNGSLEVLQETPPIFPWKCNWFLFFCTKLPGSFGVPQRPALLGAILPMAGLPKETKFVAWSCFKPSNGWG